MTNTGMILEDQVFNIIDELLKSGDLPYNKDLCRIHRRKAFFSQTRKAAVDFENVIEVFADENAIKSEGKPTLVVFFECKDHGRNVEVGRVDEVVGRLNASFGFAMKGYIVTRKGFSSGALETANSNGIGLIKIMPEEKIHYLIYHLTHLNIENSHQDFANRALRALLDINYESNGENFFGVDGMVAFRSLRAMLAHY